MSASRQFRRLALIRHRARFVRATRNRWQARLLFVVGGCAVGAVAAGLAILAERAQTDFLRVLALHRLLGLVVTPLGFGLAVYAARRWFKNSQGSGIPQAIVAHRLSDSTSRAKLVSLRIAIGKILLTLFGLLCGASAGREGPTVQIGASILFSLGQLSRRRQAGLIVAGAAAGVAAAFNTPLAGIMFGIEELTRSFQRHTSGLIVSCVIAAGIVSLALLGNYTYFGTSSGVLHGHSTWVVVPLCGIAGGLGGGLFSRIVIAAARGFPGKLGLLINRHPVPFAMLCGLAVALCGLLSGDSVYGTGYREVSAALGGAQPLAPEFGALKFLATAVTSLSTLPGGIFSPSLAIGAGLGANVASLFADIDVSAVMLIGMVAYLAGVVQAPITAFVIVMEMTDNHAMLIPLMAAALIAHATSRLVCHEGIYHALAHQISQSLKATEAM
jgi:H+/Cl- antiporter ClcA